MAFNSRNKIVTNGLVLYIDSFNTKSYSGVGLTASDLTSNDTSASLVGVGFDSNHWTYNGTSNYIQIPSIDNITNFTKTDDYTISFWVKIDSSKSGNQVLLEKWTATTAYPYVFRYLRSPDRLAIQVYNGSTGQGITPAPITPNVWLYITGVFDWTNNTLTSYVDGEYHSQGTINLSGSIQNNSDVFFGVRGDLTFHMKGRNSMLSIYNRALSSSEVMNNYQATKWKFA